MKRSGVPLFFKLWFGFVALMAVGIVSFFIWAGARVLSDPAQVGRFIGEIARGFDEVRP